MQIHLGNALIGLGDRHLDVVDERAEERPLLVGSLKLVQIAKLLAGGTQAVPSGQIDACLAPAEDPRNGTQVIERLGAQAALGGTRADRQQADLGQRRHGREPRRKVLGVQQVQIALMAYCVELLGHVPELLRGLGVGFLDARGRLQKRCGGNGLNMALSQRAVAVTGKDDLALLGELKEAVDRTLGLRQHGLVCRAATTAHGTAATVHEHQVDIVLLGPLGNALLRGVQREHGRGRTGILGGVGIAQHDLHATVGLGKALLHHGQRKHLVEHVDAALEVLELLEQRNHVELGDILLVCKGQVGKLEDVSHMLGALGERDDVAVRHLLAVALLDGTDSAEGVDDLARHGLQIAMDTVLVDILEGSGMHYGVLTELHLDHVEAEGLDLPDDGLHRAVGSTDGTAGSQRTLNDAQVIQELIGAVVHGVGDATHGGVQTIGHDEHDGAMRLVLGNQFSTCGVLGAHLDLMVPQVDELGRRLAVGGLEREVATDTAALVLELEHHMGEILGGDFAAHLGGDVGVTVAVGADPTAGMEERRAQRRHGTGLVAQHPVVKTTIDDGNDVEQRVIEDVDDGIGFLDRRGLLQRDGARANQGVNLLQHMALVLHQVGAAQTRTLLQQVGDTTNLALDGLATGLGGMRGKDGVELKLAEQLVGALDTHLIHQLVIGNGELVGGIDLGIGRCAGLTLAQLRHAVILLRQVCQMEEARKGADDNLLLIERQTVDQIDDLAKRHGGGLVGSGHALLVDGLVGSTGAGVSGVGHNLGCQNLVEQVRDLGIILAKHTALQAQEQRQIVAQLLRNLDLGETLLGLGIRADSVNEAVDHGSDTRRGFGYRLVA